MNVLVTRRWKDAVCNIGELTLDGAFECYTLELPDGQCIPVGCYRVTIERSPRFSALNGCTCGGAGCTRDVFKPRLHDVPGAEGVLIHEGNTVRDTKKCILVGGERGAEAIGKSRVEFDLLFLKLNSASGRGEEIWLTVAEGAPPDHSKGAVA